MKLQPPCVHLAPCGEPCCLTSEHPHTLHCCMEPECSECHGSKRFIDDANARRRMWREQAARRRYFARQALLARMEGLE